MSSGFRVELLVDRRPLRTTVLNGTTYALAAPGKAFEVAVSHTNNSIYMAQLFVDGVEAEPGYLKKVRPGETTRYTGYLCRSALCKGGSNHRTPGESQPDACSSPAGTPLRRRDIHEFLFAETPVDEAAAPGGTAAAAQRLGCVSVAVYATRRVRVDDSSSDDEYGHRSSSAITATRLPEKQAAKEYGGPLRASSLLRCRRT